MKIKLIPSLLIASLLFCVPGTAAEHPQLHAFPAAKPGMERYVIVLPHKDRKEEDGYKVEIIAGKVQLTDGVNLVHLNNAIEPRPLEGWGYTYYEVTGSGETISTLMAPPPGKPKVKTLVTGTPLQIPYNSRLPIVVYVPKDYEIRYRIWKAAKQFTKAEKG